MADRIRLRERIARSVLRPFFGTDGADDIVRDLEELASERGPSDGRIYYWVQLVKYPGRAVLDRLRHGRFDRAGRGGGTMREGLWNDARYAVRSLRRSPGFVVSVVGVLAITVGATTAMYSVVKGVLLDPLPLPEPDRLVSVWLIDQAGTRARMTPGSLTDVRELDGVFESVAAFQGASAALGLDEGSVYVRGGTVTHDYFETLGVSMLLGRDFREEEQGPDGPPVVILGHRLWQDAFGGDPDILRRSIRLDGAPFDVVGVAPPGIYPTSVNVATEMPFTAADQDYFVPNRYSPEFWSDRRPHVLGAIARLAPGIERPTAAAALEASSERVTAARVTSGRETPGLTPFVDEVIGDVRWPLVTILSMLALVLTIAVVNVGALFVLRADDRSTEVRIRLALGAGRGHLARQLVTESALLAAAAAALGIGVAHVAIRGMQRLVPFQIPRLAEVGIEPSVLLVTSALAVLTALFLGLVPLGRIGTSRPPSFDGRSTASLGRRRLQGGVVAVQAGLAVVVLVGALLLVRSFEALRSVDPGFTERGTWVVDVQGQGDLEALVEAARALPGVAAAAQAYDHPLERNWGDSFTIEGRATLQGEPLPSGSLRPFGAGYFETVGIRTLEGRVPDALDLGGPVPYAVVNRSLQQRYFPDGDVVGRRILVPTAARMFSEDLASYEITAVVEDVRFLGPDQPSGPAFYLPLTHFPVGGSTLLIRPAAAELEVIGGFRDLVRSDFPGLAIASARPLAQILADDLARPRFNMMLLGSFAAFGLLLCALGAYGLARRAVVSRLREMAIRMALGAEAGRLLRAVVRRTLRPMALGVVVGSLASLVTVRWLASLLYEVSPADPVSLIAGPALILLVGGVAAILPARRTLRIDPAETLKAERTAG